MTGWWTFVAAGAAVAVSACGSGTHLTRAPKVGTTEHCETLDASAQAGAASLLLARVSDPSGLRVSPVDPDLLGSELSQPPQPPTGFGSLSYLPRVADCYRWWIGTGSLQHALGLFTVRGLINPSTGSNTAGRGARKQTNLAWNEYSAPKRGDRWTSEIFISAAPLPGGRVGIRADGVIATNGQHIDIKSLQSLLGKHPAQYLRKTATVR